MKIYNSGIDISETIPLVDDNGTQLNVASIVYDVFDSDGFEVVAQTPEFGFAASDPSVVISIGSALNVLTDGKQRDVRAINLYLTLINGDTMSIVHLYGIQASGYVATMSNSYQTYQSAEMLAIDIQNLDEWDAATVTQKNSAMVEAFHRIGKMTFSVDGVIVRSVNGMTKAEFDLLSSDFVLSIRRAQVIEADVILGNDPVSDRRQEGLMSKTVGESSEMFRPGKPVLMQASRRALDALAGFVVYGANIGRA